MSGHSGARKAERIRVAVILAILIGAALGRVKPVLDAHREQYG